MSPLPESLSPLHMANNRAYEPQRQNHFEVEIYNLPGGPTAAKTLTLSTNQFGLPNISTPPTPLQRGNTDIKYPGKAEWAGAETLELIDYIGLDTEKVIHNWQRQVYDPITGKMGFAADFKKRAKVTEFAPDGTQERVWILEGVWPSGVSYGDSLSHEAGDFKRISVTITYDWAYRAN